MIKITNAKLNAWHRLQPAIAALLLGSGALLFGLSAARADDEADVTVVNARASEDYIRPKLPSGAFAPESYTFGEGGFTAGSVRDASTDKLNFTSVVRTISGSLANQNYVPGIDSKQVKLLIMVYWGTTTGTSGASSSVAYSNLQSAQHMAPPPPPPPRGQAPASRAGGGNLLSSADESLLQLVEMENRQRDRTDMKNAGILGYAPALDATEGNQISAVKSRRQDLLDDVEDNRYFVVLMAYDFQMLVTQKKPKLLWETRFSIRQLGNNFDQQLAAMANDASKYFGRDSHGLVHTPLREGQVKLNDIQYLGTVPDK